MPKTLTSRHTESQSAQAVDPPSPKRLRSGRSEDAETVVDAGSYYSEYHGHPVSLLCSVHEHFASAPCRVFLAGDSSLDNKHWFFSEMAPKSAQLNRRGFTAAATNGYEDILRPQRMVQDVSYWMNALACERYGSGQVVTLNAAVEESTLECRSDDLLPQDKFIRDHIQPRDVLVLSVGGNDVALAPTAATIANMLLLTRSPAWLIRAGWAPGMAYFERLFHGRVQELVRRLVSGGHKPVKVLACMIYYLDETPGGSWADFVLGKMGYDRDPSKLQLIISTLYERIVARGFDVEGTTVEPFALFEVLDGKDRADYKQRVEPSVQGGRKMAAALLDRLFPQNTTSCEQNSPVSANDN